MTLERGITRTETNDRGVQIAGKAGKHLILIDGNPVEILFSGDEIITFYPDYYDQIINRQYPPITQDQIQIDNR